MNISIGVGSLLCCIGFCCVRLVTPYDSGYSEWSGWPTTQAVEQCGSCQARLQKPAKSSPEDDVTCPRLPDGQAAANMYRAPAVRTAAYLSCHDPSQNYAIHCGTPARQPATSPLQHVALAKYWKCLTQTGHMLRLASLFSKTVSW